MEKFTCPGYHKKSFENRIDVRTKLGKKDNWDTDVKHSAGIETTVVLVQTDSGVEVLCPYFREGLCRVIDLLFEEKKKSPKTNKETNCPYYLKK